MDASEVLKRLEKIEKKMFRSLGEGLICSPDFSQDKQWLCSQLRMELEVNAVLSEALEKISKNKDYCVYGTYDMEAEPEKAFRQGSHIANGQNAEISDEALEAAHKLHNPQDSVETKAKGSK